jgi:metal-responsive CopG/Arc/MetJ family transcriptional regulator
MASGLSRGTPGRTYGTMYGMIKTTVYLPEGLKTRLARVAKSEGRSEAEVIRAALEQYTTRTRPRPRLPLVAGNGVTNVAEHVDEVLAEGFGGD